MALFKWTQTEYFSMVCKLPNNSVSLINLSSDFLKMFSSLKKWRFPLVQIQLEKLHFFFSEHRAPFLCPILDLILTGVFFFCFLWNFSWAVLKSSNHHISPSPSFPLHIYSLLTLIPSPQNNPLHYQRRPSPFSFGDLKQPCYILPLRWQGFAIFYTTILF